ncbi:hypothetical protein [Hymenobacter cavernae]|uniref:Uncharacterized protein n=1 Tax=Hymenobacter cavernae TaxID=2044852 RepID=A0ABQ1UK10_9BACT|nr:hypothetical protein [Hymenobacter cavernae]GGF18745.1 hypothetical protein GCM10011383_32810 [Hymenobacter cavernae]
MKPLLVAPVVPPPIILGVMLTIDHNRGLRRSLRTNFGLSNRAINTRMDPALDMIYLSETTLSGSLPCLATLDQPDITAVTLRAGYLECQGGDSQDSRRHMPDLASLATGNCFLTANNHKVAIATFVNAEPRATRIAMEVTSRLNLLDYLRAEDFTLEISGTNRRRLTRPLAIHAVLEFTADIS